MKKLTLMALMILLAAGPALAGPQSPANPDEILAVGTAQLSRAELSRLKDMVAGRQVAAAPAAPSAESIDLGVVEMPRKDLDQIASMVAGNYTAPPSRQGVTPYDPVDVGKVEMDRGEFENLRQMVARHLKDDLHLSALTD